MGHGRPKGSGDQTGSGVDPPVPFRGLRCPGYTFVIELVCLQRNEERIRLSLSTVYRSLFGDSMLESLVNLNLDASLSFLLLRTVSGSDPLSFCEVGSDGLWIFGDV